MAEPIEAAIRRMENAIISIKETMQNGLMLHDMAKICIEFEMGLAAANLLYDMLYKLTEQLGQISRPREFPLPSPKKTELPQ